MSDTPSQPQTSLVQPSAPSEATPAIAAAAAAPALPAAPAKQSSGDGGYLTLAMATAALVIAGLTGYKAWAAGSTGPTCMRTIDMPKLTRFMISDMMDKTASSSLDAADATYRAKVSTLDAEVAKLAGGCLLVRRDAVVLANDAKDITADVARAIGLDLSQPATRKTPRPDPAAMSPVPAPTGKAANEPGSKLD
ncbi:hypothetical protein [Noviherbaspirillum galbum]|uniref:Uncharacterized protein n=1 Tax=Noviherbaspirillum galbum TaxID=2709383 RepID=A0A6B3SYW6_9BURK|nr:hypothetical protein [Noviherbaspirillum galbum]NEX63389.1 hypothetical protein [Noviherbaspirillum galbum]